MLAGGGVKWRRGIKKTFFFESTACVTNGGEVWGLGVGKRGKWKNCRKRRLCVESCWKENLIT